MEKNHDRGGQRRLRTFGPGREKAETEDFERQRDELHAKIGQLTVEVDFLRKKSKQLGL